jgi:hypothetical protein
LSFFSRDSQLPLRSREISTPVIGGPTAAAVDRLSFEMSCKK